MNLVKDVLDHYVSDGNEKVIENLDLSKMDLIYEVKQEFGDGYVVVMRTPKFDVAKDKVLRLINKGIKSHMVGTPTGEE
jgi:hypothetical protein|tara:strand:- start:232 stop:468 length:237 start_codon:yes stop_codon:yes gene_type:complete